MYEILNDAFLVRTDEQSQLCLLRYPDATFPIYAYTWAARQGKMIIGWPSNFRVRQGHGLQLYGGQLCGVMCNFREALSTLSLIHI